ncbi:uncharacterized protein PGTG_08599 [Puccinia graminis f. sp. tritici CRL 75-36-700-3]|uniref:Uncharacterized protein n=1 Tax=Puccinia graminis f. sp. tritici (strain CRL 75-36-700-3 / race SCCL) TaxID=418459 RepID=E3KGI8_PUCGT|nr:uncharacterized protein PGTG_08599 [Puccinia graminis f. sp. tritici CRL 75-36-700-3]EFP83413.2 hypothetical protein PGTG_08599 [Puccinia graminis f. sp. tritici CRL 75-36-700-3]
MPTKPDFSYAWPVEVRPGIDHPPTHPAPVVHSSDHPISKTAVHQIFNKMDLVGSDYLQEPPETQESTLGPTQQTPYKGLFFEETPETRSQAVDTPDPDEATAITQTVYCFYINNYNPQIPKKQRAASNCKNKWSKITSNKYALPHLKTNLLTRKWEDLQEQVLDIIGPDKKNLSAYLQQVKACLIWHLYISGSHTFPFKRKYYCSSDEQLQVFADEVACKPLQKVFIRVKMDNPTAQEKLDSAKEKSAKQKAEKILAIAVGSDTDRLPLQREEARQQQKSQSDVLGDPVAPFVIQLRQHLEKESNSRPSEVIFWPHKEILNLANRAVDLNTPPIWSTCKWEKRPGITHLKHCAAPCDSGPSKASRPSELRSGMTSLGPSWSGKSPGLQDCRNWWPQDRVRPILQAPESLYPPLEPKESSIVMEMPDDIEIASGKSSASIEYVIDNDFSEETSSSGNYVTNSTSSTPHDLNIHQQKMVQAHPVTPFGRSAACLLIEWDHRLPQLGRCDPIIWGPSSLLASSCLNDFLVHCNIDIDDAMCQTLFKGHDVKHWSFFQGKSDEHLM